jgi:hypothetical protein
MLEWNYARAEVHKSESTQNQKYARTKVRQSGSIEARNQTTAEEYKRIKGLGR